jgi:hypothetical protein
MIRGDDAYLLRNQASLPNDDRPATSANIVLFEDMRVTPNRKSRVLIVLMLPQNGNAGLGADNHPRSGLEVIFTAQAQRSPIIDPTAVSLVKTIRQGALLKFFTKQVIGRW